MDRHCQALVSIKLPNPLSGAGAAKRGGRFNEIGVPALYLSTTLNGAWLEAQQSFAFKAQPMTVVAYQIECDFLEDLTTPEPAVRFGFTADDLGCPWED